MQLWRVGYNEPLRSQPYLSSHNRMEKTYNPHAIEQRWYETWEKEQHFAPEDTLKSDAKP